MSLGSKRKHRPVDLEYEFEREDENIKSKSVEKVLASKRRKTGSDRSTATGSKMSSNQTIDF